MVVEVPSPGSDDAIIRLTDEGISEFIDFPEDTVFMESIAQNQTYAKGVGYVPVQRNWVNATGVVVKETHIYEIRTDYKEAKHICGPLATPDGKIQVTVFGSALSSDGILYVCSFNKNAILGYDLKNVPPPGEEIVCCVEVTDVPAPNDVCIDAEDELVLWVAGGTFRRVCCTYKFSNASFGKLYRIQLSKDKKQGYVSLFKKGFASLAGIEAVGDQLWLAELFKMYTIDTKTKEKVLVWKGNDGKGQVWLADNIDVFNDDYILVPAYSTASVTSVEYVLSQRHLLGVGVFFAHLFTGCVEGETLKEALEDPEVLLSFSNTYIKKGEAPLPIKLVMVKRDGSLAHHFEVDLVQTRQEHEPREIKELGTGEVLGKRHYFNDQVTHAARLEKADGSGWCIACISFEEPRILLLKEEPFLEAMK
jgi:hypothetical protein